MNRVFSRYARFTTLRRCIAPLLAALLPLSALGQTAGSANYPSKTVRLVVPFAPGGATDITARLLAAQLENQNGQPHLVENRPGAATLVGADAVAKSAPDGYTLLYNANSIATEQVINSQWNLRFERDLNIVSMFTRFGIALVVNPSLPINNLKDLAAWSKANPGKLTQSLAVAASADVDELKAHMGITSLDVPYKGAQAMLQAVMAGEAQFSTAFPLDAVPLVQAGKVRAIVYLEKQRHPLLPNVPTVAESGVGLDNFDSVYWFGLFVPTGLPAEIAQKVNASTQTALRAPDVAERLQKLGVQPYFATVAEARQKVLDEIRTSEGRLARGLLKPR
jgi:tripartite-type tricarboxylate transporter receptor subunit TctC